MFGAELAQACEETSIRQNQTHVGWERLDNESRNLAGVGFEERGKCRKVIIVGDERVGSGAGSDASGVRVTLRECARARLHEERVDVTVVAAGELNNLMTTREAARETDGGHRGFGAAVGHADLLHRRETSEQELGHLDLERIRRAEARSAVEGIADGVADLGVVMAMDGRPPGQDEVDEFLAIGRGQASAIGRLGKERRATDRTEGADRGIDATRDHREGTLEELLRRIHTHTPRQSASLFKYRSRATRARPLHIDNGRRRGRCRHGVAALGLRSHRLSYGLGIQAGNLHHHHPNGLLADGVDLIDDGLLLGIASLSPGAFQETATIH